MQNLPSKWSDVLTFGHPFGTYRTLAECMQCEAAIKGRYMIKKGSRFFINERGLIKKGSRFFINGRGMIKKGSRFFINGRGMIKKGSQKKGSLKIKKGSRFFKGEKSLKILKKRQPDMKNF